MRIWTQKSASIQKRTSPLKFDNFAEKSEKDTVSYLSSKARTLLRRLSRRPALHLASRFDEPNDAEAHGPRHAARMLA